jgi:hypothetical protein
MWKVNEKTTKLLIFLDSRLTKTEIYMQHASSGHKTTRRETNPPFESQRAVFLGQISSSKCYSKKDYKEKKKEQHSYKI